MIETWEIWKGDGAFYDPWVLVSIRTLKKKKKKRNLRRPDFTIHSGIYSIER